MDITTDIVEKERRKSIAERDDLLKKIDVYNERIKQLDKLIARLEMRE